MKTQTDNAVAYDFGYKHIVNKYWVIILICVIVIALIGFYNMDYFTGIMANNSVSMSIGVAFSVGISALLVYGLTILMGKLNKE
jgi:hypothetical protein